MTGTLRPAPGIFVVPLPHNFRPNPISRLPFGPDILEESYEFILAYAAQDCHGPHADKHKRMPSAHSIQQAVEHARERQGATQSDRTPITVSDTPCFITIFIRFHELAPRATRIPNSCILWLTE
jgi:hypothetical protein